MPKPPIKRTSPRDGAFLKHADHQALWRMVEGATVDAFNSHPDYLTERGREAAVRSITKRVVGLLVGHAKQTLRRGRSGGSGQEGGLHLPPPDRRGTTTPGPEAGGADFADPPMTDQTATSDAGPVNRSLGAEPVEPDPLVRGGREPAGDGLRLASAGPEGEGGIDPPPTGVLHGED